MEPNAQQRLRAHFHNQPAAAHPGRWDELWQADFTPWDRQGPSLALRDAVVENQALLGAAVHRDTPTAGGQGGGTRRRRALVPGCGRGYDVLLLSALGYDVFGLDAAPTALAAATAIQQSTSLDDDPRYAPPDAHTGRGHARFLLRDFFHDDFLADTAGADFDLIFDYTFLCALPPELRPSWARRMSQLLADDGHLVCLEWPLFKEPQAGGPPHGLSPELYERLLQNPGSEVQYGSDGKVVADGTQALGENALVRVKRFQPPRTHDAGKDSDHVSIWARAKRD